MCIQFFAEASFTNNSVSYYTIKQVSTCGENRKKGILLQPAYTSALCSLHRSNCPRKLKREKCRCTAWMICRHFHFVSLPKGSCSQQAHCSLKNYLDNEIYWLCQLSDELLGASDSDLKPVSLNLNSVFKVTIWWRRKKERKKIWSYETRSSDSVGGNQSVLTLSRLLLFKPKKTATYFFNFFYHGCIKMKCCEWRVVLTGGLNSLSLPDYSAPSWSHNATDDDEDDIQNLHILRNRTDKMAPIRSTS